MNFLKYFTIFAFSYLVVACSICKDPDQEPPESAVVYGAYFLVDTGTTVVYIKEKETRVDIQNYSDSILIDSFPVQGGSYSIETTLQHGFGTRSSCNEDQSITYEYEYQVVVKSDGYFVDVSDVFDISDIKSDSVNIDF